MTQAEHFALFALLGFTVGNGIVITIALAKINRRQKDMARFLLRLANFSQTNQSATTSNRERRDFNGVINL